MIVAAKAVSQPSGALTVRLSKAPATSETMKPGSTCIHSPTQVLTTRTPSESCTDSTKSKSHEHPGFRKISTRRLRGYLANVSSEVRASFGTTVSTHRGSMPPWS
jgi:hypothetical protein